MPWVQTYSGRAVDLVAPDADTIYLPDIAVHLSRDNRFSGATQGATPYSVLQHSLLCETLVPLSSSPFVRLAALLHDAAEAYTGDITRPVKDALRMFGPRVALVRMEAALDEAIYAAVAGGCSEYFATAVFDAEYDITTADTLALAAEKRDLMAPEPKCWANLPDPADVPTITPLSPWACVEVFKTRVRQLVTECGFHPLPTFGLYE